MARLSSILTFSLLSVLSTAVEFLTIKNGEFVANTTEKRFSIIGVDYQPGGSSGFSATADPLSDSEACLRDAILMQRLGVNTVRIYNLDSDLDHSACASIFNAAGIYMIIDVNSGLYGQYIDRTDPSSTYTLAYLKHVFGIIENFAPFPNTLGFFAANEIINEESSYDAPLYIRAVVRDMRQYIANNIGRSIGVGYSAADVSSLLSDTWNYLNCEIANSTESKIDFFGLNDYEWCGDSSYTESGYDDLVTLFSGADVPVFFSEYGCNNIEPRTFTNVPVLYGSDMNLLSGGLVYEFSQETDDYGLVVINSSTEVTLREDYAYLSAEFAQIDYSTLTTASETATSAAATCSAALVSGTATFINDWDLPTPPSGAAAVITSGVSTGFVAGSLVAINTTTMPATVLNYTGATVTGLKLVELMCTDSNYPGLIDGYSSSSVSCNYATPDPTAGSASATSTKKSGAGRVAAQCGVLGVALIGLLFVSL